MRHSLRRLLAFLVDASPFFSIWLIAQFVDVSHILDVPIWFDFTLLTGAFFYLGLLESESNGHTLGKRLMSIRVRSTTQIVLAPKRYLDRAMLGAAVLPASVVLGGLSQILFESTRFEPVSTSIVPGIPLIAQGSLILLTGGRIGWIDLIFRTEVARDGEPQRSNAEERKFTRLSVLAASTALLATLILASVLALVAGERVREFFVDLVPRIIDRSELSEFSKDHLQRLGEALDGRGVPTALAVWAPSQCRSQDGPIALDPSDYNVQNCEALPKAFNTCVTLDYNVPFDGLVSQDLRNALASTLNSDLRDKDSPIFSTSAPTAVRLRLYTQRSTGFVSWEFSWHLIGFLDPSSFKDFSIVDETPAASFQFALVSQSLFRRSI